MLALSLLDCRIVSMSKMNPRRDICGFSPKKPFGLNGFTSFSNLSKGSTISSFLFAAEPLWNGKRDFASSSSNEKERAGKLKEKQKERLVKAKAREKAQKEKEAERQAKMKERAKIQKEREKIAKEKQKLRELNQKEREKKQQQKDKEREAKVTFRASKEKSKKLEEAKPKRSRSSFTFYVKEQMPIMLNEHPNKSLGERMAFVAEKWNDLSEEQKKPYITLAKEDKSRKLEQMEQYEKTLPPKRPLTPFLLFSNEHRTKLQSDNPNANFAQLGKMLGDLWRGLSNEKKEEYSKQSDKLKEQYDNEMQKFKQV